MTHMYEDEEDTANFLTRHEATIAYVNQVGDTMQGDLDINNNKLKNANLENCKCIPESATLLSDSSIVSKAYLDARLQGLDAILCK